MKLLVDFEIFRNRENFANVVKSKFEEEMKKCKKLKKPVSFYRLKYIGDDDGYYQMRKSKIVGATHILFVYYHFLFRNHCEDLMNNCMDYFLNSPDRGWNLESDFTIEDVKVSEKVDLMKVFDQFFHSDTFYLSTKNGPIMLD